MAIRTRIHVPGRNHILHLLAGSEGPDLQSSMEHRGFLAKELLFDADTEIKNVVFPLSGVVSLVVPDDSGKSVEVATIGNEGMVGTSLFLGSDRTHMRSCYQVKGDALLLPSQAFRDVLARSDQFRRIVERHTQGLFTQIAQSTACSHLHPIEQRLCRWLLTTHDRVGEDEFTMRSEFVGQMLGVRRPGVTVAMGMLQRAGLVTYRNDVLTILDREAMEQASCSCYNIVRREYERLLE